QAIENCSNSKWNERVKVHHMPLEEFTLGERKKYDLIISNPPFFINSLQPVSESRTKARHACTLTFEGLVEGTVSLLHPKGTFATILPIKESEDLINIARENNLNLIRMTRIKTTASKPAKRVLMQFGFTPNSFSEDTLVIENEDHTYTDSYKELTRDFYLGF
ncbi:MAG TPA: tRNA (adenine-N(6)-)-methyltransferase, partial [Bacteroidia bacterium]|nr:tRNA (adenine-N(6)-)-methyltransferase [Bacteroidia bacterium]